MLLAPKASRFWARIGNTMGLTDLLPLWMENWWGKRKYSKGFPARGRREYSSQEKPKSSLLDDPLPDEPHIKCGLTWGSEKKEIQDPAPHLPSQPKGKQERSHLSIQISALRGNVWDTNAHSRCVHSKVLRGKLKASSDSSPTTVPTIFQWIDFAVISLFT